MYFFFYCLVYKKKLLSWLNQYINQCKLTVKFEAEYDATVFRLFRKMFLLRLE